MHADGSTCSGHHGHSHEHSHDHAHGQSHSHDIQQSSGFGGVQQMVPTSTMPYSIPPYNLNGQSPAGKIPFSAVEINNNQIDFTLLFRNFAVDGFRDCSDWYSSHEARTYSDVDYSHARTEYFFDGFLEYVRIPEAATVNGNPTSCDLGGQHATSNAISTSCSLRFSRYHFRFVEQFSVADNLRFFSC